MAKAWDYGRTVYKKKDVKGIKNGKEQVYEIIVWRNAYVKNDPKQNYYSVTWQCKDSWSFSAGYGTEVKTNIKTLAPANKVVTSITNKIKKHTAPFK